MMKSCLAAIVLCLLSTTGQAYRGSCDAHSIGGNDICYYDCPDCRDLGICSELRKELSLVDPLVIVNRTNLVVQAMIGNCTLYESKRNSFSKYCSRGGGESCTGSCTCCYDGSLCHELARAVSIDWKPKEYVLRQIQNNTLRRCQGATDVLSGAGTHALLHPVWTVLWVLLLGV